MCKSADQGGQRCASHTREKEQKAFDRLNAITPSDSAKVYAAQEKWVQAATEYASTSEGQEVLGLREQEALRNRQFADAAQLHTIIERGVLMREANAEAAARIESERQNRQQPAVQDHGSYWVCQACGAEAEGEGPSSCPVCTQDDVATFDRTEPAPDGDLRSFPDAQSAVAAAFAGAERMNVDIQTWFGLTPDHFQVLKNAAASVSEGRELRPVEREAVRELFIRAERNQTDLLSTLDLADEHFKVLSEVADDMSGSVPARVPAGIVVNPAVWSAVTVRHTDVWDRDIAHARMQNVLRDQVSARSAVYRGADRAWAEATSRAEVAERNVEMAVRRINPHAPEQVIQQASRSLS